MAERIEKRLLFVFDFDHTLVDANTDLWVMDVRPELHLRERMTELRRQFACWTDFMDYVFLLLYEAECGREELLTHMVRLKLFDQAQMALRALGESGHTAIIISDSNSVFIDCILQDSGLGGVVSEVHTNPAHFDEGGRLRVRRYHSHSCRRCNLNMCKGAILSEYLGRCGGYDRVVYVGDGAGDYCPCLQLTEKDVVVCREGYRLAQRDHTHFRATVHVVDFVQSLGDVITKISLQS